MALNDTREGRDIARLFDRHEENLQRLREAMAGVVIFAVLTDSELAELIIRFESAYRHADGDWRDEVNLLLADVLTARDRLWGEFE